MYICYVYIDLPDTFHQMDLYGRSGYADWGFMSTTVNLDVALGYSGTYMYVCVRVRVCVCVMDLYGRSGYA